MGSADYYKPGDYNVECDLCGRKRKASECRLTWQNFFVCADTCWEPRHPQDFVKGRIDDQTVPIARPAIVQSMGETTVLTTASANALSIDITSISGLADRDSIGIGLDNGTIHWDFCNGDPAVNTVTLGSYLPSKATAGNTVYLPSVNKETFITAADISATEL